MIIKIYVYLPFCFLKNNENITIQNSDEEKDINNGNEKNY